MRIYDRLVIFLLGNFIDGPDEEFPETKSDKALGWLMAVCIAVAILLVIA